ncbi:MAG: Chitooligosaccharide deacetylase [uncultured Nocardioidaceae bacterium]|uniref:Chitooligosaccharide deacetylase n=1 Tax=uncultured Nocardioidaceae bacterium TaxID=253824 RepID=A0A6J4LU16_9ACTN|nr:MAG: Chitooligosaccharide deacetylase [uncultured Nocardioidaceae bacterium]
MPHEHGFTVVLSFDFDAEEVWIGEDPGNAHRPGTLSQGTYGAKVGVPLVLDVLRRTELPATFFVPGRVAERHPARVEQVLAAGHEVAHHGYTHTSPSSLTPAEEEDELVRGKEVLTALGAEVVGYRSPSWDFSPVTLDLLTRHGFLYSSNLMDDVRPYRHDSHPLVELPVHWTLDDAPHFWFDGASWNKTIRTSAEVRALWEEEVAGTAALGGLAMVTMHPQIIGRPGRVQMLESFLGWVREQPGVVFQQARETAEATP